MPFKHNKYALLFVSLLLIQFLKAQVTITIPSSNLHSTGLTHSDWRRPLGSYFGYERTAVIYQHAEIGQYGTISALNFFCDSVNVPGNTPVIIYMKEVPTYTFTFASTVASEETGAQLVYSGTLASASFVKNQWVSIPLSNPFTHATANSVEIIIETNAGGAGNEGSLAKGFYHYPTSYYTVQYWSADNAAPTGIGAFSTQRPNIQMVLTPVSGCSGVPNAGTSVASVDTTCSAVSLSLAGGSAASGLTYQWEDSLSGGAWQVVPTGTVSAFTTSITASASFRCKVSCGGLFAYSSEKEVVMRNYLQCYCNSGLGGGCSASAIDSVAIPGTTLLTSATGCSANNYILYPAQGNTCAQLATGQTYNLHTRFTGVVIASMWIDYNQNGAFDSLLEWTQICTSAVADSDYVTSFVVPGSAKTGLTLMRIRSRSSGNLNGAYDACTNFGSGETEDYFVGINYDVNVHLNQRTEPSFTLYPNPANESIWIAASSAKGEELTLSIYTPEGELVKQVAQRSNGAPVKADIAGLSAGVYFVKASWPGFSGVKKLIITR